VRWAALLRGVNLGRRQVHKGDLIAAAESLGYREVRTLLASGNLIFETDSPTIEPDLRAAVLARTGVDAEVFARSRDAIAAVVAANPFPEVARERGNQLLVLFHHEPVPLSALEIIAAGYHGPERLEAVGRELFIDYPDGMGRSMLDAALPRLKPGLPQGTGRNWNTVAKLAVLLG
jgi:uncharacterized protein (DUF1697 family)